MARDPSSPKAGEGRPLDRDAFRKLRRIAPAFLAARRPENAVRALPEEIAFKLTNRCNLRCKHCYQWNDEGHHHDLPKDIQNQDLDFEVLERVFEATRELRSNVYLWGGEPLIYRHWDRLVDLLERDPRWTAMCTNGLQLHKRLDSILRISEHLEILFALEGFRDEHDAIRGPGTFDRVWQRIDLLVEQKAAGAYRGEIAINLVITDPMVGRIHEFLESCEGRGIDTVYLSLLWYISPETAGKMDDYVVRHFQGLCTPAREDSTGEDSTSEPSAGEVSGGRSNGSGLELSDRPSWHAYTYHLDPAARQRLIDQLARVGEREWGFKLRYNPAIEPDEVDEFIRGGDRPLGGKRRCLAIRNRMDVFPDGRVVSCKFFGEFMMGDLHHSEVAEVWRGERFERLRRTLDEEGLMPVCSKCNLLYSRGL